MTDHPSARLTSTSRIEAFSDGVFAIAITLLVLDLKPPAVGHFAEGLRDDWTSYVAYLAAFMTIASIWVSHHNAFSRVRRIDPAVMVANLALLLGVSLIPWPTALISAAIRGGHHEDEVLAVVVYALLSIYVSLMYALVRRLLYRRPRLLESAGDAEWMRRQSVRDAGATAIVVVAGLIALAAPLASLVIFLVVPLAFLAVTMFERDAT